MLLLPPFIRLLLSLRVEQSFRTREEVRDLADLHGTKAHTPTMGGVCIWFATVSATLLWGRPNSLSIAALYVFSVFGAIGLADDLCKFFRRSSRGLAGRKKLFWEGVVLLSLLAGIRFWDRELFGAVHEIWIPACSAPLIGHLPTILAFIFAFLIISGCANAVNLTDGADGLAAGCSLAVACSLAAVCMNIRHAPPVPGAEELAVLLLALAGALLAFFWHNCQPARIFMGDGGSLAIGGLLGTAAFLLRRPFLLAVMGGVFVAEALSVMAQVFYFQRTGGRRIFRMAPLHHHFELGGCPESRVVGRFLAASLLCCCAGLALHFCLVFG
jgi:phospho-N-acetylmuramoyl-pentapeptide-transferase